MKNIIEESSELIEIAASQTVRLIDYINQPKIEAQKYFINAVKNSNKISEKEAIALICNSRKIIRELANCETILENAKNHFFDNTDKKIDDVYIDCDWLNVFFDKARLISNIDLQIIWSHMLSKKMENPQLISLSLLHSISIMSTEQANFFVICVDFVFAVIIIISYIHYYSSQLMLKHMSFLG